MGEFVRTPDGLIHFEKRGGGPALTLLHPWGPHHGPGTWSSGLLTGVSPVTLSTCSGTASRTNPPWISPCLTTLSL